MDEIVPGMKVEATQGDLGEQDVSSAQVTEVKQNQEGNIETLKVSKGILFRKQLNVPADRVEAVDPVTDGGSSGKVIIDAREEELEPLAGPLARYLFAIGLIGSGLVAIPVLLASTSYAVAGSVGWPGALARRPWQNEGFYLVLTTALVVSLVITLLRIDPIKLIFWANVIAGVIAPLLVIAILLVGNNRKIMQENCLSLLNNFGLVLIALILVVGAALLFYGLATGQGG